MGFHDVMGVFAREVVKRVDHTTPDFTDPWPVKDVSDPGFRPNNQT